MGNYTHSGRSWATSHPVVGLGQLHTHSGRSQDLSVKKSNTLVCRIRGSIGKQVIVAKLAGVLHDQCPIGQWSEETDLMLFLPNRAVVSVESMFWQLSADISLIDAVNSCPIQQCTMWAAVQLGRGLCDIGPLKQYPVKTVACWDMSRLFYPRCVVVL